MGAHAFRLLWSLRSSWFLEQGHGRGGCELDVLSDAALLGDLQRERLSLPERGGGAVLDGPDGELGWQRGRRGCCGFGGLCWGGALSTLLVGAGFVDGREAGAEGLALLRGEDGVLPGCLLQQPLQPQVVLPGLWEGGRGRKGVVIGNRLGGGCYCYQHCHFLQEKTKFRVGVGLALGWILKYLYTSPPLPLSKSYEYGVNNVGEEHQSSFCYSPEGTSASLEEGWVWQGKRCPGGSCIAKPGALLLLALAQLRAPGDPECSCLGKSLWDLEGNVKGNKVGLKF